MFCKWTGIQPFLAIMIAKFNAGMDPDVNFAAESCFC